MGLNTQNARISLHGISGAGSTFSIPPSEDFTDGNWSLFGTELMDREIGINTTDNKAFIRIGGSIHSVLLDQPQYWATGQTGSIYLDNAAGNTVSNIFGVAIGSGAQALNIYSTAIGYQVISSGIASLATGASNAASGNWSFAGGVFSTASGLNSFVFGSASSASGNTTIVLGNNIQGSASNTVYVPNLIATGTTKLHMATASIGNAIEKGQLHIYADEVGTTLQFEYRKADNSIVYGNIVLNP